MATSSTDETPRTGLLPIQEANVARRDHLLTHTIPTRLNRVLIYLLDNPRRNPLSERCDVENCISSVDALLDALRDYRALVDQAEVILQTVKEAHTQ